MSGIIFGGIEAGGTKFVVGIGSGGGELLLREEIPTTSPQETLAKAIDFFKRNPPVTSLTIGSFGPVDLDAKSNNYGTIQNSPKADWVGVNIRATVMEALQVPTMIVTDTDVAVAGEYFHGVGGGIDNLVYVTVGTGIGGSMLTGGHLLHGRSHPEIGHMPMPLRPADSQMQGACMFHGTCLEGLTSGKSMELLYASRAELITDETIWSREAYYLAIGLVNVISMTQPERIVLGGGVMQHPGLIDMIRRDVATYINEYFPLPPLDQYIVRTSSDTIGVLGAIKMASLMAGQAVPDV